MVKSLPQFTINRFISCLISIGQYKGKIPVNSFRVLDSKGNDLRRLFSQLEMIEKPDKNDEFLIWTFDGEKLYNLKDDEESFGNYLHHILLGRIPQYKVMVDLLSKHLGDLIGKQELFKACKEKVAINGWNLPEPTFNGLVLLARKTALIESYEGKYQIAEKTTSVNLVELFNECISPLLKNKETDLIYTEEVLICFIEKQDRKGLQISQKLAFDLLTQIINELDIEFEFGVGTDGVPGTHALLRKVS